MTNLASVYIREGNRHQEVSCFLTPVLNTSTSLEVAAALLGLAFSFECIAEPGPARQLLLQGLPSPHSASSLRLPSVQRVYEMTQTPPRLNKQPGIGMCMCVCVWCCSAVPKATVTLCSSCLIPQQGVLRDTLAGFLWRGCEWCFGSSANTQNPLESKAKNEILWVS